MTTLPNRAVTSVLLALGGSMLTAVACGGGYSNSGGSQAPPLHDFAVYAYSSPSIAVAGTVDVRADGYYGPTTGPQTVKDLRTSATWSTSNAAVATVDKGHVVGAGVGSATISATSGHQTGSIKVAVGLTPSVAITPSGTGIFHLSTTSQQQFGAQASYADGTALDLTVFVTWSSSPSGVVVFDDPYGLSPGLATFIATGTTTITATCPRERREPRS